MWIALVVGVGAVSTGRGTEDRPQEVSAGHAITLPSLPLPDITIPTLPAVSVPPVSIPPVTLPPVTVPALPPLPAPVQEVVEQIACVGDGTVPITHDGLWLVDADRGCARVYLRGLEPGGHAFSPDGRSAVVSLEDDDDPFTTSTIWRLDLVTGVRTPLVAAVEGLASLTWSPDGNWISYRTFSTDRSFINPTAKYGPGPDAELWLVRPDGSDRQRVAGIDQWALAAWSADSRQLAVAMKNDSHVLIYDLRNGTERRFPVPAPYLVTWSPDGTELLVDGDIESDAEVDYRTYRMDARTGAYSTWAEHTAFPRWSPDGQVVASYLGYYFGDELRLQRPDGTVLQTLSPELPLNWSSDSRYLLMTGGSVYDRSTSAVRQVTVPGSDRGPWPQASRWVPGTHTFAVVATGSEHYTP